MSAPFLPCLRAGGMTGKLRMPVIFIVIGGYMWQASVVAVALGEVIGSGASLAFSSTALAAGKVSAFKVRQAATDLFRAVQESSITSRAVGAGAASPDSTMKEVRARSRFTVPMPSEPFVPARISAIFASRFFSASAAALAWGSAG